MIPRSRQALCADRALVHGGVSALARFLFVTLATLFVSSTAVSAHEVRPAFLELVERAPRELVERAPREFDVLWKVPALGGAPLAGEELEHAIGAELGSESTSAPSLPCGCPAPTLAQLSRGVLGIHPVLPADHVVTVPPRTERMSGAELKRWSIRTTESGLEGWEVAVHGLPATMVDVLVRIELLDGRSVSRLLRPDQPSFTFHADDLGPNVGAYFVLGVEHILFGVDHLLFVLCLLLLVRGAANILKTITAFTLAHSITLGLATLGYVTLPPAPVEAVIALSIVFLATEVAKRRTGAKSLTERRPWLVAFVFGLLHGFGFAGALSEVGLPPNEVPPALLLFNVGVEAGQLLFVGVVMIVVSLIRRVVAALPAWTRPLPAYGIGSVAAYWLIARTVAL